MVGTAPLDNPSLTVALAMVLGIAAQSIAKILRLPGIVILLGVGCLLGPDFANLIRPASLGSTLQVLVGFAVAIILFEGGMALNLKRLNRANKPIRRLVTVGALVTLVGATLTAYFVMGWGLQRAFLFGTLVIVTGPTVITPLLKRLQVERKVATVLEAEGVLIDAVGAVVAAVGLEIVLGSASSTAIGAGLVGIATRLAFGIAAGLIGGVVLAFILKRRSLIPDGLENVFTLAAVLALFQGSNALLHESGIAAVTVAGMVVGRGHSRVEKDLHHFKEQLTTMLIGMLFILLAADVRIDRIIALGKPAIYTVVVMMFIVRPLNVFAGTYATELTLKQKAFMGWIGPRGIIAAAVASHFAVALRAENIKGGDDLQALVFVVIAATVLSAGLTGGLLARVLGLRKKTNVGWAILGANALARAVSRVFIARMEDVVLIESDPDQISAAEKSGARVVFGNGLEERTRLRADIATRRGVLSIAPNEETNLLFARSVRADGYRGALLVALDSLDQGVTPKMVEEIGADVLFGAPNAVDLWSVRFRQKHAMIERWIFEGSNGSKEPADVTDRIVEGNRVLPLVRLRKKKLEPFGSRMTLEAKDQVYFAIHTEKQTAARKHIIALGFSPAEMKSTVAAGK